MKEKNPSAIALGKRSAEVRFKGMGKKEKRAKMRELWLKSIEARKNKAKSERSLTK